MEIIAKLAIPLRLERDKQGGDAKNPGRIRGFAVRQESAFRLRAEPDRARARHRRC